jgi:diamine N-acetyltransferase
MLSFRKATVDDAALIALIGAQTFINTYSAIAPDKEDIARSYAEESFQSSKIQTELSDSSIMYFVASEADQPSGYAKLIFSSAPSEVKGRPTIELERIYLEQHSKGRGIGKAFLQELMSVARKKACMSLWLAVYEENLPAIGFYEKFGFQKVGTREFHYDWNGTPYSDTDVIMERNL